VRLGTNQVAGICGWAICWVALTYSLIMTWPSRTNACFTICCSFIQFGCFTFTSYEIAAVDMIFIQDTSIAQTRSTTNDASWPLCTNRAARMTPNDGTFQHQLTTANYQVGAYYCSAAENFVDLFTQPLTETRKQHTLFRLAVLQISEPLLLMKPGWLQAHTSSPGPRVPRRYFTTYVRVD
jgi:hypothetical protein